MENSDGAVRLMRIIKGLIKFILSLSFCFVFSCAEKKTEDKAPVDSSLKPLTIIPAKLSLTLKNQYGFAASGGTAPYTYLVYRGFGSIDASTGVFTAPPVTGSVFVRVTDSAGNFSESTLTINDSLKISPATKNIPINGSQKFTSVGGVAPLKYTLVSGGGSINSSTGVYTAPATAGPAAIRVTDAFGNISNANVTVFAALTMTPSAVALAANNTKSFVASGGAPPYTYSLVSGGGLMNASTGVYTAPSTPGTTVVRVTDSAGNIVNSTITINPSLTILPSSQTMSTNGTLNLSASGGVSPYAYSILSGSGTVDATTGVFTAPASSGTTVVRVIDSYNNFADSTITIILGLGISPAATTLAVTNTQTFSASGGTAPYAYSVVTPSGGLINSATGVYTAPAAAGTYTIRVTDSVGVVADATVTVNPALAISPAAKILVINNTFTFSSTGGVTPYTYSVRSGTGSINSSTGLYTAPAAAGSAVVRVTDNKGNISESTVMINPGLSITSNGNVTLISAVDTLQFSSAGGISPYTYSVLSGSGSINASTGLYTAIAAGQVTVQVTDSTNATSEFDFTVNPALTISPNNTYVTTDSDNTFAGVDGVSPYTYSLISGVGLIDSTTGTYTSPSSTGSAIVRVTDSMNHTADSQITIYNELTMTPLSVTMAVSTTQNFSATGGYGALTYSVVSGLGSIDSNAVFTASATGGSVVVRVEDTIGNMVDAAIDVVSGLTISPQTLNLPVFSTVKFTSILGTSPYTYSVLSGSGSVVAGTGVYTGQATAGVGTVQVEDAALNTSVSTITHITPVEMVSGSAHTCVRYNNGGVKCWGQGNSGQLGYGSTANVGSTTAQVGGAIGFVDLGTSRKAIALSAGQAHTCAILDNFTLKCWGSNGYGQLGQGNTTNYGSAANQMGNNLPPINLGTSRTAQKVFAFGSQTCVVLDTNVTKCFGRNTYGQLGLDDTTTRGSVAGQMGDSLPAINLGNGRTALKIVGGIDYTCALLDNANVKCFGRANYGQTGYENTNTTGNISGSMTSLPYVNLGTGLTVTDIAASYSHTCAILNNGTVKCWGRNQSGQLGTANTLSYGDTAGDMGNNLAAIPLTSFTPVKIWAGRQWSCAANSSNAIRCWGLNSTGQLMVGNTNALGDGANEIANLVNINFGTSVVMTTLSLGSYFGCGITTNNRIKCFGSAAGNALLNASTTANLGDVAGELGDGLPWVNH